MREKITFEPGQAVRVKLDQPQGKQVDGRTGPQYMRVVDDDERIIFADPELEQAIRECGAEGGDVIQILKIGNGKKARWDVGIVAGTTQQPTPQQPPTRSRPAELGPSFEQQLADRKAQQQPAPAAITSETAEMTAAFVSAIDASAEAERYASRAGIRDFHLDTDAIKNLAVTIYIHRAKGGR
jgi:hypothetical protein